MFNAEEKFVSLLADTTLKATVLLGLTALLALAARRASAAARHLIWSFGLIGALFLPLFSQTLPHFNLTLPSISQPAARVLSTATETEPIGMGGAVKEAMPKPYAHVPVHSPFAWTLLVWLTGAVLALAHLGLSLLAVRRIERASRPFPEGPLTEAAERACQTLALPASINFRLADAAQVPMAWGLTSPTVVLPAGAELWPEEQTRAALLHELAHIQRKDWLLQLLGQVACAVYWFHPLAWLAARQARWESEIASDNLVLGAGIGPADYASHLLTVARTVALALRPAPAAAVAMAEPSTLRRRVTAILSPQFPRTGRTPRMAAGAFLAALACTCTLSALQPIAAVGDPASTMLRGVVVVVDPGHGGFDSGVSLPNGVTEKSLNLAIAEKLRAALERRGAKVYLTRSDDTYMAIGDRARFANQKHANYFISVHCDGISAKGDWVSQGAVYYHAVNNKGSVTLALAEMDGVGHQTKFMTPIISDTTRFRMGFGVLREAKTPAVLIMCGNLNVPNVLARLRDPQGQERIAVGVANGLEIFIKRQRKG